MISITQLVSHRNVTSPDFWGIKSTSHLDIGCGNFARNPFNAQILFGADISQTPPTNLDSLGYVQLYPDGRLPFLDGTFDSISGFDFIEHLSREIGTPNLFIQFMNEASRVLKPGGILLCVTPSFPSPAAFQDPTHVNIITEKTINYFLRNNSGDVALDYGITSSFELVEQFWVGPFSSIRKPNWKSEGLNPRQLLGVCKSFQALRAFISSLLKPSHLVWVLRKT